MRASSTENTLLAILSQIVTPRARRISVYKNRRKKEYVWIISGYKSLFGVGWLAEDWKGVVQGLYCVGVVKTRDRLSKVLSYSYMLRPPSAANK